MSLQVGDEAWATEPDNHFSLVKIVEDKGDSFLAAPREHADETGAAAAASEPKLYKKALLHATNPRFMDGVEDMIDLSHLHEVRYVKRGAFGKTLPSCCFDHVCKHRVAGCTADGLSPHRGCVCACARRD